MSTEDIFQGVVCCSLDRNKNAHEAVIRLLDLKCTSVHQNVDCYDLKLENKYYKTTIHLFDHDSLSEDKKTDKLLLDCRAIILYVDGATSSVEQLDAKLEQLSKVAGELRVLICDNLSEDCPPHKTLQDWCISTGYVLLRTDEEDIREQLIDSLSAYKWAQRSDVQPSTQQSELNGDLLKKLMDFDNLLNKLGAYRDRPELRGDPNDKNIEEIAEILSGLLGDDVDNFLDNEEQNGNSVDEK